METNMSEQDANRDTGDIKPPTRGVPAPPPAAERPDTDDSKPLSESGRTDTEDIKPPTP